VSLHGPTAALVTEFLQLPSPDYGTVYHHIQRYGLNIIQSVSAVTKDIDIFV